MPRRARGVTAAQVERGTKPGRFGDGAGLYLAVRSRDAKFWVFRFRSPATGKAREMGLGTARGRTAVSLADARRRARKLYDLVREGIDPLEQREVETARSRGEAAKAQAGATTFGAVADMYLAAHRSSWRNAKHCQQWHNSLRDYVLPVIGSLPVGAVDTDAVKKILDPLWAIKTETGSRIRGRIEAVLDYAKARGWREGENPARWRGHLENLLPARSKAKPVEHHAALPWRGVGAFMQRLRQIDTVPARCLEFLTLTAARSGEVRGMRWSEISIAVFISDGGWATVLPRVVHCREVGHFLGGLLRPNPGPPQTSPVRW